MSALALRPCARSAIVNLPLAQRSVCSARIHASPRSSRLAEARLYSTSTTKRTNDSSSSLRSSTSSVSPSEVSHFNTLASSWWDPYGPSRLLHLMNPLRHDFIRSCIQTSLEHTQSNRQYSYLDIGCGGGIFASSAARLPNTSSVTAIDPTASVIAVAQQHQRSDPALNPFRSPGKLKYINCAIEDLSQHTPSEEQEEVQDKYDIVTLFEVLEHVAQPSSFLHLCLEHLKPGGWLIGSTISRHPVSYVTTKLIAEAPWPLGIVPRGTHDWEKYIKPEELSGWFEQESNKGRMDGERAGGQDRFGQMQIQGVVYLPVVGWKFVNGSEAYGNYFFGVQKLA